MSDQAHPLHAEKLEVPSYLPHPGTMDAGHADHVDFYVPDRTLMVKGQIASIAKTGEGYMLTIPTPTNGNCRGCVQFVEVDGATSIVTYAPGDVTALKPGLDISLSPLGKKGDSDDFWETHTLLVGENKYIGTGLLIDPNYYFTVTHVLDGEPGSQETLTGRQAAPLGRREIRGDPTESNTP